MELEEEDQRKTKRIIKKPNGFKENQTDNKKPDNDNDDDDVDDNENENSSSDILNNADVAKIDKLMIECLNTTNTNNILECTGYLSKIPIELIEYALKKTSRKEHPSWEYAMVILDDYVRKKFTKIEQVEADELNYKNITKKKTGKKESNFEERNYADLSYLYVNKGE